MSEKKRSMSADELEKKAECALVFLHENAREHGKMRARCDYLDAWVKSEKARIASGCAGMSAAASTMFAEQSPAYLAALSARQEAAEEWYAALFLREAAQAHIDAWRTACSNERAYAG